MFKSMINFIKDLFFNDSCGEIDDLIKKLQCIKKKKGFCPYDKDIKNITIKSPEKNIFNFLEELDKVMKMDLDNEYVRIKKYRYDLLEEISLSNFFTKDGYVIKDYERVWNKFINTSLDLALWVYNAERVQNNIYKDVNSRFLKSYIIYIDTLVSELISKLEERRTKE